MKLGIALFVLFAVAYALFKLQGGLSSATTGADFAGIDWRPVNIAGEAVPGDTEQFVRFEVDGSISGHGGCNRFFGALQKTEAGIEVGPLGATRMACPEPVMGREDAFLDAIQRTKDFGTGSAGLSLLDEHGKVLASLVTDRDL